MALVAAMDVGMVVDNVDDFDLDDFDVVQQALDLDPMADDDGREFRGGGGACYSAIFSDADIVSHCRSSCDSDDGDGDGDSGAAALCSWLLAGLVGVDDGCSDGADDGEEYSGSSSPADSVVTDDGTLTPVARDDDAAEAMFACVAEMERFLLEDDDDEQAEVDLGVVDDYFAGDQLLATGEAVPACGVGPCSAD